MASECRIVESPPTIREQLTCRKCGKVSTTTYCKTPGCGNPARLYCEIDVDIRMSPAEHRALKSAAHRAELPIQQFVRRLILAVTDPELFNEGPSP